jgi:cytochrome P450
MHKNPTVFPDPQHFYPERWLDDAEPARSLRNAHLMPFGAGSRACVGKQLAQALLHMILAGLYAISTSKRLLALLAQV